MLVGLSSGFFSKQTETTVEKGLKMDTVFAPRVRCYLKNLLEHSMQNLTTPHPIRLVSASHGGPKDETKQLCDRFKISLPYAGQTVTWEVIFQAHKPELPPDFIFDDTSFVPNIEEVPSLCEWDSEDDQALTNVIQELLEQYRKHQASMLDDSPRLQFEYSSLVHQSDIPESNIQVHLNKKVEQVSTSFAKRKEYVAAFLNLFGRNLLEFDAEGFASLSFLFEHDDFFFILIIAIPRTFPQDKPSLTFQSAYHTSCGWPYSITCTDYPYSPRWEASEMAGPSKVQLPWQLLSFSDTPLREDLACRHTMTRGELNVTGE
ncbi:hypothetical protein HPB51_014941 [Rhipicephalus microplus]|uniref:BRISC and BRCA1-A complex member 2 n=1 Tax=Rhipicephalus microplus TaxID=6941 RepID=A0A9J6E2B7_RHIMP|nr:hypothetical protein HPB51_014941 [Rhipicephalus microplus]